MELLATRALRFNEALENPIIIITSTIVLCIGESCRKEL